MSAIKVAHKSSNQSTGSKKKKRHNRKIESVSVREGLYLRPYRKGYDFFLKPYSKEKELRNEKTNFPKDHYQIYERGIRGIV